MPISEQVRIMEAQVHSEIANFSLFEKLQYLKTYFEPDADFSREAIDIVIGNISRSIK